MNDNEIPDELAGQLFEISDTIGLNLSYWFFLNDYLEANNITFEYLTKKEPEFIFDYKIVWWMNWFRSFWYALKEAHENRAIAKTYKRYSICVLSKKNIAWIKQQLSLKQDK